MHLTRLTQSPVKFNALRQHFHTLSLPVRTRTAAKFRYVRLAASRKLLARVRALGLPATVACTEGLQIEKLTERSESIYLAHLAASGLHGVICIFEFSVMHNEHEIQTMPYIGTSAVSTSTPDPVEHIGDQEEVNLRGLHWPV